MKKREENTRLSIDFTMNDLMIIEIAEKKVWVLLDYAHGGQSWFEGGSLFFEDHI